MNITSLPGVPSGWTIANQNEQAELVTIISDDSEHVINISVTPFTPGNTFVATGLRGWSGHPLFAKNSTLSEAFEAAVDVINDVEANREIDPITTNYAPSNGGQSTPDSTTEEDTDFGSDEPDDSPAQTGLDNWA